VGAHQAVQDQMNWIPMELMEFFPRDLSFTDLLLCQSSADCFIHCRLRIHFDDHQLSRYSGAVSQLASSDEEFSARIPRNRSVLRHDYDDFH
jgi:hypothetical protein